jgi:ribosomal protein S18 acetylase RimI-like enzyme
MIQITSLDYESLKTRLQEIIDIENKTFLRYGSLYDIKPWTEVEFLSERKSKDIFSCAAIENNVLVGFSIAYEFDANYGHISRLAALSSPGKKIGSALVDFQIVAMQKNGIKICSVDLISGNAAAYHLYASRGFRRLEGQNLFEYLDYKKRDRHEYIGNRPSHIAMIKEFV